MDRKTFLEKYFFRCVYPVDFCSITKNTDVLTLLNCTARFEQVYKIKTSPIYLIKICENWHFLTSGCILGINQNIMENSDWHVLDFTGQGHASNFNMCHALSKETKDLEPFFSV